jgi:hypothetical protein
MPGFFSFTPSTYATPTQTTTQAVAPSNVPVIDSILKPIAQSTIVDVINIIKDYDWTYSRNIDIDSVPKIEVKEFKIAGNSYISSLITSALLFPDIGSTTVGQATKDLLGSITDSFKDNKLKDFLSSDVTNIVKNITNNTTDFVSNVANKIKAIDGTASSWPKTTDQNNKKVPVLENNYAYLYLRSKTGRTYTFPYFEDDYISIKNEFNDTYSKDYKGLLDLNFFKKASDIIDKAIEFSTITEPGTYIQRPKFYNFNNNGTEIKFSFYLFNTLKSNEYSNNLTLISRLVKANMPKRINRILVDPPCIYELKIPGKGFYPYTYVSLLDVEYVGTKRMVDSMIVPDAYKITIQFTSLTMDESNLINIKDSGYKY